VAEVPEGITRLSQGEGRAVDRFVVSRGDVLESPATTGEVQEQQQQVNG